MSTKTSVISVVLLAALIAGIGWYVNSRGGQNRAESDVSIIGGEDHPAGNQQDTSEKDVAGRQVQLYYYNESLDRQIGNGNPACSADAIQSVSRELDATSTPIQDTIRLLIAGNLSSAEREKGLSTEFPQQGFELKGANLQSGVLTLEFSEVPGFTTGGSCRIQILSGQIEKTAMQFDEVEEVRFKPESLFQP